MGDRLAASEPASHDGLVLTDLAAIPDEPARELLYSHRPHLWRSARKLMGRGDVIFTLAERDIRAQYKQAILGLGWALVNPLVTLVVFLLLLKKVNAFAVPGQPKSLFLYIGILTWGFFAGAVAGASGSLLANKLMMAKTHFPRECFPLAQVVESAFSSSLACIVLVGLFFIEGFVPKIQSLWVPLYLAVEIPFAVGMAFIVSSVIIQMRDLNQVVPIFLPLAMLLTPVIWPFSTYIPVAWQPLYSFVNPVGPIINMIRYSVLSGQGPEWSLLAIALCGSLVYLFGGYALFKRLEVSFADLA